MPSSSHRLFLCHLYSEKISLKGSYISETTDYIPTLWRPSKFSFLSLLELLLKQWQSQHLFLCLAIEYTVCIILQHTLTPTPKRWRYDVWTGLCYRSLLKSLKHETEIKLIIAENFLSKLNLHGEVVYG